MIVLDASAALSALLNDESSRAYLADEQTHAPHLIDSEVMSGLRRSVNAGRMDADRARATVETWQQVALIRYPVFGLLGRIWDLRDNLTPYDAGYVALAEALNCPLVTADARISRAAGVSCPVTVVPA